MSKYKDLLFLDIETSPNKVYTWGLFNQTISIDQVITPASVLCWAAKWHGDKDVMFAAAKTSTQFEGMVRGIHRLLSEAEAVCHYNGRTFDIPRLNQEFLRLKLAPPPPIPQIDLKQVVMSKFSMTSSKLAFVGPYLEIGEKVKHEGWDLWKGCLVGDATSWRTMEKYNRQDVVLLEKLYDKILPWIDQHPNRNLVEDIDKPVCPNCGEDHMQRHGYHKTVTQVYIRYKCMSCGKWSRARTRDKTVLPAERR